MKLFKLAVAGFVLAAVGAQGEPAQTDKAAAYYHYSLGHLYSELSGAYGSRGDFFDKAVDNYWAAMKADPSAGFIAEELSDFYIQSGRLRDGVTQAEDALKKDPDSTNARRVLARIYMRLIGDSQANHVDESMVKKAIEQYRKITAKNPEDFDAWLMLGRLEKISQNSNESMKAYKKALEISPGNAEAMTGLAMVYSDLGDSKGAADLLSKVAQKDPSPRTLSALASTYEQMKEYSLAAETLRRVLNQTPDATPELKHALAQDLMLSEQYDEALKVYQGLTTADPKDVQSFLRMSQIYRQKGDFAKAHEAAAKARDLDPSNLEIRFNDVNLLEAEGKFPDAIAALQAILTGTEKKDYSQQERGNRGILLDRLGFLYRSNEQYDKAVETFREVGQLDTSSASRSAAQVVDTYRAAKDYKNAVAEADAAYQKYPNDHLVREIRASVLSDVGRADEAIADVRKMLDGKNDRETYVNLAQIYEKAKRYDDEAKALDSAEKLSTVKDDKVTVYFLRGAMYEKLKKYDQSEAEFRKVLDLDPNNASALNYIGYMLADRSVRLPEAREFISRAVERDPNNGAYLDSLGWVYFKMNNLPEAETNLRRAVERMSNDPTVHDHLGDVYFHQGKIREAIAQWQNSLKQWQSSAPSDQDPSEVAKIEKKVESARVRLARESGNADHITKQR